MFTLHTLVPNSWNKYPCEGNWENSMSLNVPGVLTWKKIQGSDFRQEMFGFLVLFLPFEASTTLEVLNSSSKISRYKSEEEED